MGRTKKFIVEFFRPNYRKLIMFFVLSFILPFMLYVLEASYFPLYPIYIVYFGVFSRMFFTYLIFESGIISSHSFIARILLMIEEGFFYLATVLCWYFLSCAIVYLYDQIKRKKFQS